ncbi:DUF4249 domain-containing protein [Parapedobacter sp. ISTM3]|uniref:DUF4249 domain-containing protein n=1 Tax=Parapedobacter luteus TaxID=623280 RepID=A0A1T5A1N1_9SPHI|nr:MULTISPECIES: DUF4249 family protein [Parapedobacter]MBK1442552.1 DUF4249 domain-containing protein [Parapedobacter sp. ISTM3]SKB28679.1 protein of unknown function [Parapedobacter luteus]
MNTQSFLRIAFSLTFMALFVACEKVVDIDLDTAEPRLVVDAAISWEKGTDGAIQRIKLSTTTDYYATEIPTVSGATVYVTNTAGQRFDFIERPGTGEYICTDFVPELHSTYELRVVVGDQTYTATETLVPVPEISRVEQRVLNIFGDNIEVRFYFNDDGNAPNFYLTEITTGFLLFPSYEILDNQYTQGNELFQPFIHSDLESGDEIRMSLSGISQQFYSFMGLILASASGDPFSTPPANIRGNIVNQTDAGNYALGYFRLSETDTAVYRVE